jgi:hypothetical protein
MKYKRQTHHLLKEDVTRTIAADIQLENKITGRGPQGACRQDKLIGGKQPVVK